MKKIIICFVLLILTISCVNYKYLYIPTSEATSNGLSKSLQGTLKSEQLFLSFSKSFENSKVEIFENDVLLFNGLLSSTDTRFTKVIKISSLSQIRIQFDAFKKPLVLSPEQMKNYKFIYLEKKKNYVLIEFNNSTKTFNGSPILD